MISRKRQPKQSVSDPLIPRELLVTRDKRISESDVQTTVTRYAKSKGLLGEKFSSPGKRSVPDYMYSINCGFIFFIEYKAPGKTPTTKQDKDHKKRRERGCYVFVVDDIHLGKWIIDLMIDIFNLLHRGELQ